VGIYNRRTCNIIQVEIQLKYWNKSKKYRDTWTAVEGPAYFNRAEVKRWCQLNGSSDRFYFGPYYFKKKVPGFPIMKDPWLWYFENSEDALAFSLIWSRKVT
jgi:hypothetical protein